MTAFPQCFVDIYTYEGTSYSVQGAQVLECEVSKSISPDQDAGTFSLTLAPGGPKGVNQSPSWAQVITPMSLVVIGMRRGTKSAVTMLGIVRVTSEPQQWPTGHSGAGVQRVTTIAGFDFSYFFSMFTYYSLWYLGATGAGVAPVTGNPSEGLPTVLGGAYLSGDPGTIASAWFTGIMAGDSGVLSKSFVPFNGTKVSFGTAISTAFELYDVSVPYGEYFVGTEGSWADKFKLILPFPFYEFFVITAPASAYSAGSSGNYASQQAGTGFTSKGLGSSVAGVPTVVTRRNPLPVLTAAIVNGSPSFNGVDATLWQKLPVFQLDETGFIESVPSFDESQVHNLYTLNPTWASTLNGGSNASVIPYVMQFGAAGDTASIHRYGLRPASMETHWLTDINGDFAKKNGGSPTSLDLLTGKLLARFASYWHPTPLMAKSSVTTWLRPDILPGMRFRYAPFKGDPTWDFYITAVSHRWEFGGASVTRLTLERGLPTTAYADSNLLLNVHLGNATRQGSTYSVGLPYDSSSTLAAISLGQFQQFLSNIAAVYSSPQTS